MQLEREIGKSGIKASAVGLGTWAMGGWMWGGGDDDASVTAIRAALDAGVTLIDTAPAYGLGRAEELVGRAIEGRRDEVVLVTKCGLVWDRPRGRTGRKTLRRAGRQDDPSLSRRAIGARRAGGEPEAAAHRPCRRADHALAGPDHADRRDDGRAAGAEEGRQGQGDRHQQRQRRRPRRLYRRRPGRLRAGSLQHARPRAGEDAAAGLPAGRHCGHQLFQPGARAADRNGSGRSGSSTATISGATIRASRSRTASGWPSFACDAGADRADAMASRSARW